MTVSSSSLSLFSVGTLDVNSLVSQLMTVEAQPLTALQQQETTLQSKISAYGQVASAMSSLQTAIAKLRNQLLRRPETTFGCVFVSGEFTEPALIIADFAVPHRILLWQRLDIEACLTKQEFAEALLGKYRHLCRYGFTDYSPYYRELKV